MNQQLQSDVTTDIGSTGLFRYIVALLFWTIVTWGIGLSDIHYRGEAVIAFAEGFPGDLSLWRAAGEQNNIAIESESVEILRNVPGRSYAIRQFPLPKPVTDEVRIIRATGVIFTEKKIATDPDVKAAAYMIWFLDNDQKAIQYSTIQDLTGDFPEYRAERILSVPAEASYLVLAMHNNESQSHFALNDASARLLAVGNLYQYIGPLLFGTWALLIGFTIYRIAISISRQRAAVLAILLVGIVTGVLLPETVSTNFILPVLRRLTQYLPIQDDFQLGFLYKVGHFLFFLLMALFALTNLVTKNQQRAAIIIILVVFAVATEGLQLHLFHRSTRLWDLTVDLAGIALAMVLTWPRRKKSGQN